MFWSFGICGLREQLPLEEGFAYTSGRRDVMASPVQLLFIGEIPAEITQPCHHPIFVVVVHCHAPQATAPQVAILHGVLARLLVVLLKHLFAKVYRSEIVRLVRIGPEEIG